jgi:hypothetical protein
MLEALHDVERGKVTNEVLGRSPPAHEAVLDSVGKEALMTLLERGNERRIACLVSCSIVSHESS